MRGCGATVIETYQLPAFVDIVVAIFGMIALVEIKDGDKPPSQRRLTDRESELHFALIDYPVFVVKDEDDCERMIDTLREW